MDKVKITIRDKTAILDKFGSKIPPLVDLAQKIDMNSGALIAAFLLIFSFFMLIFHGIAIAMTTFTVIYPAIMSVRAIETDTTDDDKHWLTYWMILGCLEIVETFFSFIFYFIPYWDYLRVGLFVWLLQFNGAEFLFTNVCQPILKENKDTIK